MNNNNILISGAGIAGTTLAFWLKKFGFNPTLVESAPKLREGGYAIDFMGAGFDVAEKMGIIPALEKADFNISKIVFVDKDNNEKGSMNYQKIKKALNNRAFSFLRSDLAKIIYNSLEKEPDIFFGDSIQIIEQDEEEVKVTFKSGLTRSYDLLIGADGLHSNVRELIFGNESQFEKYYGYYSSSFTINNFFDGGKKAFSMLNVPYKQVAVYSINEEKTAAFFIFTSPEKLNFKHVDIEKQKQILKNEFINVGWKCPELLSKMDTTPDFYFDSISQIKMDHWSKGRISLVGDACDCPSLLSGKGSTLAMVGAYILAGELKLANGNYKSAFAEYENIFKPFIDKKQKSAQSFAKSFVPKSNFGIWTRNLAFNVMSFPVFTTLLFNQFKDIGLNLKEY
jgi:2-polyprenyl-6-methoxyphenol hydroxylase-like FAD-dependent oxidoreductase